MPAAGVGGLEGGMGRVKRGVFGGILVGGCVSFSCNGGFERRRWFGARGGRSISYHTSFALVVCRGHREYFLLLSFAKHHLRQGHLIERWGIDWKLDYLVLGVQIFLISRPSTSQQYGIHPSTP